MKKLFVAMMVCGMICGVQAKESTARKKARMTAVKAINDKDLKKQNSKITKMRKAATAEKDKAKKKELFAKVNELYKALDVELMARSENYKAFVEKEAAQ